MATFKLREYTKMGLVQVAGAMSPSPMADETDGTFDQSFAFSGVSVPSAAFQPTTRFIGCKADVAWAYQVADAPVALQSMIDVAAGTIIYLCVRPNQKIAVIAA